MKPLEKDFLLSYKSSREGSFIYFDGRYFIEEDLYENLLNFYYSGLIEEEPYYRIIDFLLRKNKLRFNDRSYQDTLQKFFTEEIITKTYFIAEAAGIQEAIYSLEFCKGFPFFEEYIY